MIRSINLVSYAEKGILPNDGGLLSQSAWFVALWSAIIREQNLIERERWRKD